MHIGTEYDLDYAYDTYGRFSTITNGGDVFTYGYLANSNLIASVTYPNTITVTNAYELNRNLIDYVENKHGATVISKYDYANDAIGRRTAMAKSGTAFTASDTVNYTYNGRSELTGADAVTDNNYNFIFVFDNIGNRQSYTSSESGNLVQSIYATNNLNQYTAITNPTQAPTYDADGDMLSDGTWSFTWNAENRLIAAEKSDAKLEFQYDYAGRRVEKKVYSGSAGNWTLDKHLKFVYDGYEQIEELDGANSDAILKKRIWGLNKLICDIHNSTAYYALGDANKNITEYLDSSGNIQAHYEYSPFGKITAKTGTMQNDFDYRFSSEVFDSETSLVYYNFRYYNFKLGRWLSRDPIAEKGGNNLYAMVRNNSVSYWDELGLRNIWQELADFIHRIDPDETKTNKCPICSSGPPAPDLSDDSELPPNCDAGKSLDEIIADAIRRAENGDNFARLSLEWFAEQQLDNFAKGLGLETEWLQINTHKKVVEISFSNSNQEAILRLTNLLTLGLYPDAVNPARLMVEIVLPGIGGVKE